MRSQKIIATTLFLSSLIVGTAGADPLTIRNGWIVPVTNLASILFAKAGIAKHNGQSYVMEPVRFQGSTQMITALATGELEIGLLAFSSLSLGIQNAGMDDLRIIADEIRDGAGDYYSHEFMVRTDSPIRTIEDLKGKVLATNAIGAAVDIAMRAMLLKHGLGDKNSTTIVEGAFPNMKAMLIEGKVDLIPGVLPFSQDPELRKSARTLFTEKDAMGPNELAFLVARAGFIEKNRPAMVDFLEDYLRAVRFYTDPANHAEAVAIAARFSKLPPAVFENWLFTKKDYYRDPRGLPDLDALQSNVDLQQQLGFLKNKLAVKTYVDLSLVQEAAKRLD
jgi:NitT/TauT family transport system substrate-binding protein